MKRSIFTLTFIIAMASLAFAQVSFTLIAPSRVAVGERFPVTFQLKNAEGSSLKAPTISGCKLLMGPSESTSRSSYIVNGRMTSSSRHDYTYYYRAEAEGTYTIGEASIIADGKPMTTKSATLTIVPAPSGAQSGSAQQAPVDIDDINTQSADRSVSSNDVFVKIYLSKATAYEQEAIECTIKLYTKYSISSFFPTKQPSFDGFLIQELDLQPALNEIEQYNGQNYMTAILKKCIIFPQKSGKLTINSGNYDIKVVQYDNVNMGFFTVRNPQERDIKVSSNSASINIKPLPFPQPDGFTGAVGKFNIDSRLVGNSFRTNEPATLIYTISGTGNIKYIKEPVIDFPSEFEQYTPKSDIVDNVVGGNVTGKMTIEYTFVPQSVGDFKIGSDDFVYFDVDKKEYVTITTPAYNIKVVKGLTSASTETGKQNIAAKNTDILHIHLGDKNLKSDHTPVIERWWYWMIYVIIIMAFSGVLYVYSRNIKRSADVTGLRLAKANKVAQRRLKLSHKFMVENNTDLFYEEMLKAIWGYLSDKLSIPASQLSRDNISSELAKFGAPDNLSQSIIEVLDDCEMARYAPVQTQGQTEAIYAKATEAINNMENLKRKKSKV